MQIAGILVFALTIPLSALLAERGRKPMLIAGTTLLGLFGLVLGPLFLAGTPGILSMMILGLGIMGLIYGPMGTMVSELFPTAVRYTGSSIAFSIAGILGASLAPYIATWLATRFGLPFVGYYLSASAALSLLGLFTIRETKDEDLAGEDCFVTQAGQSFRSQTSIKRIHPSDE
jgi:MFS family permease